MIRVIKEITIVCCANCTRIVIISRTVKLTFGYTNLYLPTIIAYEIFNILLQILFILIYYVVLHNNILYTNMILLVPISTV